MDRNRMLAALALALPVAGALASIAANESARAGASEWRIPIAGYDPRDPLRGRYVQFRYVWQATGDTALCEKGDGCALCLEQGGAAVRAIPAGVSCPARVLPASSDLALAFEPGRRASASSRLWVSEAQAPGLERQLRAYPMVAVARLTRDGRLFPVRLEPARGQGRRP